MLFRVTAILCFLSMSSVVLAQATPPGQAMQWHRSFTDAQVIAKQVGKPLLVISTGLGWCHACNLLERDVLSRPEFQAAIADRFVFVELTSEDGEDATSQQREKERQKFNEQYICQLVPTTMLIDPSGQPFYIHGGFDEKGGVPKYLEQIDSAMAARATHTELTKQAQAATGLRRAELLDAALKQVDQFLEGYKEHNDDPLLFFYPDTIREILSLTNSAGPIAQKYIDRQKYREEYRARQDFFKPIYELSDKKEYQAAIDLIDQKLAEPQGASPGSRNSEPQGASPGSRNSEPQGASPGSQLTAEIIERLEDNRLSFLERGDQYEAALEYARQRLARPGLSSRIRDELIYREIVLLYHRLGHQKEGLARVDEQIAEAGENKARRRRWLHLKSQLLLHHGPVEQSIETYRIYRELCDPASDDWHQATGLLGHELKRGGHYAEALQMVELFLARERIAQMTLLATDIAISQKNFPLAEKYLAESKSILEGWSKSERGEDREDAQRLQPHFEEIQAKLKAALPPNQNPTR